MALNEQAAFFRPTVANGALRTWLDLLLVPPVAHDPGCVKTLRGIIAPGILGSVVMWRAKKRKNVSSARHYDQIRFRLRTTKTQMGHRSLPKNSWDFNNRAKLCPDNLPEPGGCK